MKNKTLVILIVAMALLTGSSIFASEVHNVELKYHEGNTVASIGVKGTISFTHQIEVAKDGKPYRVIVDVLSATFQLPARHFSDLPNSPVQAVRSSQYAVTPDNIVRVVFDMDREREYEIDSNENGVFLTFSGKNFEPFQQWSSLDWNTPETPVSKPVVETPVLASNEETVSEDAISLEDLNQSIDNDRASSLQPVEEPSETFAEETEPVKSTPTHTTSMLASNYSEVPVEFVTVEASPEANAEVTPAPVEESPVVVAEEETPAPVEVTQAHVHDEPVVAEAKVEKPKAEPKAEVASVVVEQPKEEQSSTSRFRRTPAQSRKIQGTMVAEFPKRLVIKYKSRKNQDPFESLINESKNHNSPVEHKAPNVEGLRLVGIIESDGSGNRALFEDNTGYGYILQSGDKVQKGYVIRVDDDRVYFQIFEYGWSRTVSLILES